MDREVQILHSSSPNYWKKCQSCLTAPKRKSEKSMSKIEAAKVIQTAFRNYRRKKLVKKLNNEIIMKFRPGDLKKRPRREKVLELFNNQNKEDFGPGDRLRRRARTPARQKMLPSWSLFQTDQETVLIFGGIDPHNDFGVGSNTGRNIFKYSASENTWEHVGALPEPRHHHSAQFLKGKIFLVGGADPRDDEVNEKCTILNTVWSFDPSSKSWFSEPCLHQARKNFGLVACNQKLYAIGGQGKHFESLGSVERFNMDERLWETRGSLIHSRIGLACATYKNYIWVAGGLSGTENKRTLLDSVETYNTKTDQWTEIRQPLHFPRCFSRLLSMGERLYLIGGAAKSVEKDVKEINSIGAIDVWDTKNVEWKTITEMHIPRHGHSVAYLGTQILVIGGVTTTYKRALSNTECFCSQRGTWVRGLACLPTGLSGHASVTLPPTSLLH